MFINIYKHITTNEELRMSLKDECFYKGDWKRLCRHIKTFSKKIKIYTTILYLLLRPIFRFSLKVVKSLLVHRNSS